MKKLYISAFLSVAQTVITIQSEPLLVKDLSSPVYTNLSCHVWICNALAICCRSSLVAT